MKAKLINANLKGWQGVVNHYELSNGANIVVSRANTFDRRDETMIFICDKDANVTDWSDLYAGYGEDHETAVQNYLSQLS